MTDPNHTLPPQPGGPQQLGAYVLEAELARGGQGVVYRGRHTQLGHAVAVKVLKAYTPQHLQRFRLEAQVLVRLQHPNLPRVIDLGEHMGQPYLVMDLLEGEDLSQVVRREGPLSPERATEVLTLVAQALQHCHERGVVHRDVKPKNIVLHGPDAVPMLVDFGLLKRDPQSDLLSHEQRATRLTQSGEALGTPAFMAPEQIDPHFGPTGPAADVYGLGATLQFLLTGAAPFSGAASYNVLLKVMQEAPPDPRSLRADVPAHLAELCRRSMSKTQSERPPSAQAFSEALDVAGPRERGAGLGVALVVVGLLAVVVGFGGWALATQDEDPSPPPVVTAPPPSEPVNDPPPAQPERAGLSADEVRRPWVLRQIANPSTTGSNTYLQTITRQIAYAPGVGCLAYASRGEKNVWRYDGATWEWLPYTGTVPGFRYGHAVAWDRSREVLVVFGGRSRDHRNGDELWEWKSPDWRRIEKEGGDWPPKRRHHNLAYDHVRKVTVVFGGTGNDDVFLNDVWEWTGRVWLRKEPERSPSPRSMVGMSVDPITGRVLVFGGRGPNDRVFGDLWEWDGSEWTERRRRAGEPWPPARREPGFAHGPAGQVLLHGGTVFKKGKPVQIKDTWLWDGAGWTELRPSTRVPTSGGIGLVYDEDRRTWVLLRRGGARTWERHADSDWVPPVVGGWTRRMPARSPQPREGVEQAMTYDGERVVLFGGHVPRGPKYADLWGWDGTTWSLLDVHGRRPPPRFGHGLVWDAAAEELVVIGGRTRNRGDGDFVWSYKNGRWTAAHAPKLNRTWPAVAYDSHREAIFVFGGESPDGTVLSDLWRRSRAGSWEEIKAEGASPRNNAALGYLPEHKVLVLFGGHDPRRGQLNDLYGFSGARWNAGHPNKQNGWPYPASAWRFVFDGHGLVLAGGTGRFQSWTWIGGSVGWSVDRRARPPYREFQGVAYDRRREVLVMFGGARKGRACDETWECSFPYR